MKALKSGFNLHLWEKLDDPDRWHLCSYGCLPSNRVKRGRASGARGRKGEPPFFFYEHPTVFMSFIHACCKALQFSQALQHHKSLLILLSFSISLCVFSVWLSLPLPSPCLPPSQSTQSSCLGQTVTLPWHFSLCGPLTGGRPVLQQQSWLLFYELCRHQTIILMLILHLMEQNLLT